ncbi:O-antigen ligase family protein [Paracidobacterium acidisoli]|uniref:O-antigen ligase domain-containing protein n=1 Tax=Paracidobacterium acidisoli TaxID=2303751 RepID=A0A372IR83_9BACT|nr:O-antigen ligase family protein [Paracidobacterium acidisoli]MBT9330257.1 O-antigen ligase family protein [Paracidobacterium acidisoli]
MPAIVFAALIASIYQIKRRGVSEAVLRVYLPALLLIPGIYSLRLSHLPPLNFSSLAIYPIGIALLFGHMREWKLTRTDLWVMVFMAGAFYSNLVATGMNDAIFFMFDMVASALFPYMIGKLLLEQPGMRERFARRFVGLMFIAAVLSLWEFRMGTNIFTTAFASFFPGQQPWLMQVRGGWVRVAASYQSAELCGIVFLGALMFGRWLVFVDKDRPEKRYFRVRRSVIIFLALALGVFMSESRGPWLGGILGLVIAQVGASKNVRRAVTIVGLLLAIGGTAGYFYAQRYTAGSIYDADNLEQESAIYRRQLLENYKPIVEQGGFFGWGAVNFPKVPGQNSVDNEFLLVQITQGQLGFWLYVLLCGEAAFSILRATQRGTNPVDLCFYTCLGGLLGGELLTLTTVYMGGQTYMLFFLAVGWSQSLRETQTATATAPQLAPGRFAFQKVFA